MNRVFTGLILIFAILTVIPLQAFAATPKGFTKICRSSFSPVIALRIRSSAETGRILSSERKLISKTKRGSAGNFGQ